MFGRGRFLDREVEEWHFDVWRSLLARFAEETPLVDTPVVLPTREFFPASEAIGHERALHVFACVKRAMGMEGWVCELRAQSPRVAGIRVADFVALEAEQDPGGTFWFGDDGQPVITYAPDLLDSPGLLVAVLAHELAHLLLSSEDDLVDDPTHELMTDMTVAYTGCGVFGANAAFSFAQHGDAFGQGWRSRSSGYLSPRSWAFTLAVFSTLRGDDGGMGAYLKPDIEKMRQKALAYLRKNPALLDGLI